MKQETAVRAENTQAARSRMPGQVVLVFQGGGALGAYQAGVFEALHEAGVEPDWVIGTSIGAINGAIVAGNPPAQRLDRLREFWQRMQHHSRSSIGFSDKLVNMATIAHGIPAFFKPTVAAWRSLDAPLPLEKAAYYDTGPLQKTLLELVDFDYLAGGATRLTVGAVNARSGEMRYFDSDRETLAPAHVMASGALPPAFPAVRIDGEPYWDGGIYSNTPIEAVFDDMPRRDSVIFSVQVWNPHGPEPASMAQVIGKQKDIQYASRASHIESQRQLHHLRHVIRELARHVPAKAALAPQVRELTSWGCGTTMHIVKLNAPVLVGEDHTKDVDFTTAGIRERWLAGYYDTRNALAEAPWTQPVDPVEGVIIHEA